MTFLGQVFGTTTKSNKHFRHFTLEKCMFYDNLGWGRHKAILRTFILRLPWININPTLHCTSYFYNSKKKKNCINVHKNVTEKLSLGFWVTRMTKSLKVFKIQVKTHCLLMLLNWICKWLHIPAHVRINFSAFIFHR